MSPSVCGSKGLTYCYISPWKSGESWADIIKHRLALRSTAAVSQPLLANDGMDNKTAYGCRKHIWLKRHDAFYLCRASLPLTSILAQLIWQLQLAVKKILHTTLYFFLLRSSWNNTLVKSIYSSIFNFFNMCSCVCEFACVNLGDWPSPWQTVAIWPRGLETDTVC